MIRPLEIEPKLLGTKIDMNAAAGRPSVQAAMALKLLTEYFESVEDESTDKPRTPRDAAVRFCRALAGTRFVIPDVRIVERLIQDEQVQAAAQRSSGTRGSRRRIADFFNRDPKDVTRLARGVQSAVKSCRKALRFITRRSSV